MRGDYSFYALFFKPRHRSRLLSESVADSGPAGHFMLLLTGVNVFLDRSDERIRAGLNSAPAWISPTADYSRSSV